ncbi:MAG TPA: pirin family protein [Candidatus Limnocylindria bacterium]|jgi:redox-sensitive bicupin YhaK (pirin superfamily)|nr:pirin family protein [Candidatus Limnocylindria bacterium]
MSNLLSPNVPDGPSEKPSRGPVAEPYTARSVELSPGFDVWRALPQRGRRMVGAWCFLDHVRSPDRTLDVAPHPHIGLQTVTWLHRGAILHLDSLGNERRIAPGELNLMTSGAAIAHAEIAVDRHAALEGLQLWVALPESARNGAPAFEHHDDLPLAHFGTLEARVVAGELDGHRSPATIFSELVGAELRAIEEGDATVPLDPRFEYAALLLEGEAHLEGTQLPEHTLLYLGEGRERLSLAAARESRIFLFGGVPFGEPILMWWNFVARTPDEIARARDAWERGRFGAVRGYEGDVIPAPPLPVRLRAT